MMAGGVGGGSGGAGGGRVEVISSKGCSRLFVGLSSSVPSFRGVQSFEAVTSTASSSVASESLLQLPSNAPFSGLVICVTGLSKGIYLIPLILYILYFSTLPAPVLLLFYTNFAFCIFVFYFILSCMNFTAFIFARITAILISTVIPV